MWLLHLIPDSLLLAFINILLTLGVVGCIISFFIKMIPFVNTYKLPLQIVSVILLATGVYFKGGYETEMDWREKVEKAEDRAKKAEKEAKEANGKIQYVFVDRVKTVKEVQFIVQERIKDVSVVIDSMCKITPESVDILNSSAKNVKPAGAQK